MQQCQHRLSLCVWELTLACNLRCGHCGSSAGRARPNELTTAEALDLVAQLVDLGCQTVGLSGGEPTLRPDWDRIVAAAVRRGLTVTLVSNGTTMTPELAGRAADAGLNSIALSLDGTALTHEALRGTGTYRKVIEAAEQVRSAGLPFAVMTHLNTRNLGELERIHARAEELGAFCWQVQLGKPMGNLAKRRDLVIPPAAILDVMPRLARLERRSTLNVRIGDSLGYFGPDDRQLRHRTANGQPAIWAGCQAGRMAVGIESDGGVKGCLSLQARLHGDRGRDPFREGTLREHRLADLWNDPDAFAYNRRWSPAQLSGACRDCRYQRQCRGGAKCVAAAFTGGLAEHPYCYQALTKLARKRPADGMLAALRRQAAAVVLGAGLSGLAGGACIDRSISNGQQDAALHQDAAACEQGCDAQSPPPDALAPPPDAQMPLPDAQMPLPDANVVDAGEIDCSQVCCSCEYFAPPTPEEIAACCQ